MVSRNRSKYHFSWKQKNLKKFFWSRLFVSPPKNDDPVFSKKVVSRRKMSISKDEFAPPACETRKKKTWFLKTKNRQRKIKLSCWKKPFCFSRTWKTLYEFLQISSALFFLNQNKHFVLQTIRKDNLREGHFYRSQFFFGLLEFNSRLIFLIFARS